ncbi:MAG: hypothetical protein FJZ15_01245 [Candidatus Omnitrophica bacterium]|nr:hypothetical protein [Candidatus Omnitrophota bacterium]
MVVEILIIQLITFVAIIVVMRVLFYKHVNSALSRLRQLQEEALIKESQIKEELDRIKQERLAEVERGKLEAKKIIEAAKKDGDNLRSKVESLAKEESQKIISFGQDEVQKMKQELMSGLKQKAVDLSIEMIKYTFTNKGMESLQHELMDELIAEIDSIDKERFAVKTDKVGVVSSSQLSSNEKSRLVDVLSRKLGSQVVLEEKIDPGIISGFVIQMNEFIIDGSLKNKLNKAVPYLHSG